jgi:hypothetical protein
MEIISIIFYIVIGLFFLGVMFPYQEIVIGLCALVIGVVQLIGLLRR